MLNLSKNPASAVVGAVGTQGTGASWNFETRIFRLVSGWKNAPACRGPLLESVFEPFLFLQVQTTSGFGLNHLFFPIDQFLA